MANSRPKFDRLFPRSVPRFKVRVALAELLGPPRGAAVLRARAKVAVPPKKEG